jgi:hypothetical protein
MKKNWLKAGGHLIFAFVIATLSCATGAAPGGTNLTQRQAVAQNEGPANNSVNNVADVAATFNGAWEKPYSNGRGMLYFVGDTYALYSNDKLSHDGVFTIDGNKLYLRPYDTGFYLYTFTISSDGLTLKKDDAPDMSGLWTRSPYNESSENNAIVGSWRNEAGDKVNILRFYDWGGGSWFHCNAKTMEVETSEELEHDLAVNGIFKYEHIVRLTGDDAGGWGAVNLRQVRECQYTLEGNRLVLADDGSVYIKQ